MNKIMLITLLILLSGCFDKHDPERTAEKLAVKNETHPLAGFWKYKDCNDNFGIAIAPAEGDLYSLSFCGPGGCFKPGSYRPNSNIQEDSNYKVKNMDTIEIRGRNGFSTYVRCSSRESTDNI